MQDFKFHNPCCILGNFAHFLSSDHFYSKCFQKFILRNCYCINDFVGVLDGKAEQPV